MIADDALDRTGHSFGYRGGAEQAFLQVVEREDAAVDLYRSIGCEVSHRYWHRRAGLEET